MRLTTVFILLLIVNFKVDMSVQALAADRPNIVLMMADDLGWGDLKCFREDSPIETPHLNQMAAEGMRWDRFYASSPVCSPTRGSCLTGQHPSRLGIPFANSGHLKANELTLAERLRELGYATGHFGKWHLGTLTTTVKDANRGGPKHAKHFSPPWQNGFDVCFSTESKVPTWDPMLKPVKGASSTGWNALQPGDESVAYRTRYWDENGREVTDNLGGDDSRVIMDRVGPFVASSAAAKQPFFVVIWFHTPHLPVVAGPHYAERYDDQPIHRRNYFGSITAMDDQVGRLRQVLRNTGVDQDTMIWFASDNGPEGNRKSPGSAGPFRGRKRSLYEGGIRVPAILHWPQRVRPGSVTDFPAVTSDYLPTILDALGESESTGTATPPEQLLDGMSLLPVIDGDVNRRVKPIGFRSRKQLAWTTQQFKLFSDNFGETWQLFDLLADPSETTDLAPHQPDLIGRMSADLQSWVASCDLSLDGKADESQPAR
ncbi:MAG: sulfatase-like hydrolase/transferase [Planctomycetota bacterium]